MSLQLQLLPARQGDAIWIRWRDPGAPDDQGPQYQMMVDMGTAEVGRRLRDELAALPDGQRELELLVVTHIDSDHIGGVLSCFVDDDVPAGVVVKEVWFNGLDHLSAARLRTLEEQGGVQGKRLMDWLAARPWNQRFGGAAICRDGAPKTLALPGGLTLTVLGPTPRRLAELEPVWARELEEARRKQQPATSGRLEAMGGGRIRPALADDDDLRALSAKVSGRDASKANGSSIVLLLEQGGRRVLLTGDAYAGDIVEHLASLGEPLPVAIDGFKLPHHGSAENTTRELIEAVDCPLFLFSTDGTRFKHPDAATVACVIEHGRRGRPAVELGFNQRSVFTQWWDDPAWAARFKYRARFGDATGLTVAFDRK